jgi:hypothetical protein
MYVDEEDDILYVYWRYRDSETAAPPTMPELRAILGDIDLPEDMVVLPARFSFLELKQWRDSMARHVLRLPGIVLIGIDEAKNRLLIGVEDSEARDLIGRVEQQLAELDIPFEAVNLVEVGPIELGTSLLDLHRPVVGGLQIAWQGGSGGPLPRPVADTCTLGFNAIRRDVLGFVTNSHCSARRGRADSTVYYQPTITFDNQIGIETVDPPTRITRILGLPFPVRARFSDSNFSRLAGPIVIESAVSAVSTGQLSPVVSAALGFIARPALVPSGPPFAPPIAPPLAWDGVSTFRIIAERGHLPAGTFVTKVGKRTGRTEGRVLMQFHGRSEGVALLNQYAATYFTDRGDSGSPVIKARVPDPPGNPIDTSLVGINIGFISNFRGRSRVAVFSPIEGVQADLGSLNTCAPPLRC